MFQAKQKIVNILKNDKAQKATLYLSLNAAVKSLSIILLPFITENVSVYGYGQLTIFSNFLLVFTTLISLGTVHTISVDYFKLPKEKFNNLFVSANSLSAIIFAILLLGVISFSGSLNNRYGFSITIAILIPVVAFCTLLSETFMVLLRNRQNDKGYATVVLSKGLLEFGLVLLLVVWLKNDWIGRVNSIAVSGIIIALLAVGYFYKNGWLRGKPEKKFIKQEIIYSFPILLTQIGFLSVSTLDKFFLEHFSGTEVTGIYGLGFVIGTLSTFVLGAVLQFLAPVIYKILSDKNGPDYASLKRFFFNYTFINIVLTALIFLLMPLGFKWFINEKYHDAINIARYITLGSFFWNISFFCMHFLYYYKLKRKLTITSLSFIITGIGINYFAIKLYGLSGAAFANIIIHILICLFTFIITRKLILGNSQ